MTRRKGLQVRAAHITTEKKGDCHGKAHLVGIRQQKKHANLKGRPEAHTKKNAKKKTKEAK